MLTKLLHTLRSAFVCTLSLLATASMAQTTIHVGPGQTYTTIQSGINAANNGDTVLVAPGTYNENINFKGKAITVVSAEGAANTIIQGDGTTAVVTFDQSETRNSVLNGFTIQGVSNPSPSEYYPGVLVGSAPTILNNIITNNPCNGIDVDFGGPLIQGNVISNTNTSNNGSCGSFTGSGIVLVGNYSPASIVIGNTIIHNQHAVDYDGGGLLMWAAEHSVIESNVFAENATPTGEGGGIATFNSDAMIIAKNLFYANVAEYGGGAIALHPPEDTQGPFIGLIQNNTFAGNSSVLSTDEYGEPAASQVYVDGNLAQYEFTDNIIIGADANPALVCGTDYNYLSITPLIIDHNDIFNSKGPAYGGACPDQTGQYGNISSDPLFKDAAGNDYHLLLGSPAIDTGNNSALQLLANLGYPLTGDLDGNPRVQDATGKGYPVIDMGVYEYPGAHTASPTTMVLNPSSYDVNGGQSFTLTANLYSPLGTPADNVTFFEDGTQIGTSTIDGAGAATLTLGNGLVPGTHAFIATYPGQGNFTPCESVKIYVIVNDYGVTLTLTSAPNPSQLGQNVTFQIKISSENGVPQGSITLTDNSTNTTLATLTPDTNGNATYSISTLAAGSHTIQASYPGNTTYSSASDSVVQVVESGIATTETLTSSLNPAMAGQSVTFTAQLTAASGTPTGAIQFLDGTNLLSTQTVSGTGSATFSTNSLAVGSHTITATYIPTGSFAASSATCSEVVNALPTTSILTVTPATSTYGSQVTLTATVSPATLPGPSTPTGVVTFYKGASAIGTGTLAGGVATLYSSSLPGGSYNLTCMYSGSSIYATSNCNSVPVIINAAPTALSLSSSNNPAPYLSTINFTARLTVNGQSAGAGNTIHLSINGQTISLTTDATGSATYTIGTLLPNSYPVAASFATTNNLLASSASLIEVITAAPTSISLTGTPNPGDLNQPVTMTATVISQTTSTPVGSGSVTFYDGSTSLGSSQLSAAGTASVTTSFSAVGIHNITAVYDGDSDFTSSTSAVFKETIVAGDFSISVNPGAASVYTGVSTAIQVSVTSLQGFNQPLALTCSGLPANATCSFSPDSLPEGHGAANLVIQTAAPHEAGAGSVSGSAGVLGALMLLLLPGLRRRRGLLAGLTAVLLAIGVGMGMAGCGSPKITGGTPPGTYQVAVTATTTGTGTALTHSAVVTLTVISLF